MTTIMTNPFHSYLVIPRANRMSLKVRAVLKRSEEEVPRGELCNYLRTAIAEQRRVDASYASAEGSIPSVQAGALPIEPKAAEVDIRLVLPPEPQVAKGTKGRPVRKHRHATKVSATSSHILHPGSRKISDSTQSVYYDKASDFASSTKTSLPIIGLDLPLPLLAQLALDPAWVTDDEAWRGVLSSMTPTDRKYVDSIREAVREVRKAQGGAGCLWLFSVREGRVSRTPHRI
jgi:translation initiation factor 2-alpha kinase 4